MQLITVKTFKEKIKVINDKLMDKTEGIGSKELALIFSAADRKKKDKKIELNDI